MKVEAKSIEELILQSGDQRETMIALDQMIQAAAPALERYFFEAASITMIGYGKMPWITQKQTGTWPVISLAPQKGTTNVYVSGKKDDQPILDFFGKKIGKVSVGKSCIRVKRLEHLDKKRFDELIASAAAWNAENHSIE